MNQFADWLIELSNCGFGLSKNAFRESVKTYFDKDSRATPVKDNKPGNKIVSKFRLAKPKSESAKARPLEKKRARISKDTVDAWFTYFKAFLIKKKVPRILLHKSGIAMRLGSTCKDGLAMSLVSLTEASALSRPFGK